jgi:hypothetical protein
MQCTKPKTARTSLLRPFAAVTLIAGALLLVPAAHAQMDQTKSLQTTSPSTSISEEKLNAAAAVIGQAATIEQSYKSKIAAAPPSDIERLTNEADDAFQKAVTDQGLSVDEYHSIIRTAENDPTVREQLIQRIPPSSH